MVIASDLVVVDCAPVRGMNGEFFLWQQQVRKALQGLRYVGRGYLAKPTSPPPTFQEAMLVLYNDSRFSKFIASRAWQQAGLDNRAERELLKLQQQLDAFDEPDVDGELDANPAWQIILLQVKVVTALLF
ncbi:hypothetical protein [Hymenobacter negativus]|uniref:Uncharacterized protein n=1 Tax=Hymenobacter negativus TaxID=2795026 RepID=A0ABS3QEE1_9BACT|nr:hypothetical protein [Hymenobacter negativus]MBO2009598.1 hypothetical protein [Hymenobacter negativus]